MFLEGRPNCNYVGSFFNVANTVNHGATLQHITL